MKVLSIAGRCKSVSEIWQSVAGAREERASSPQASGRVKNSRADEKTASSPQPSPPEEERERISQTRSKEERKLNASKFKSVSHPLVAACIVVYGAPALSRGDD